jgi:alanine dehydrogenase
VLIPGARAPRLVRRDMLAEMKPGSVIVDVAVDQGGCIETIRATTHDQPTFTVDGVVHYGVANMPGAVPNTSTTALSNQTLPYALRLAGRGPAALLDDRALQRGLNTYRGRLTHEAVGNAFGLEVTAPLAALEQGSIPA